MSAEKLEGLKSLEITDGHCPIASRDFTNRSVKLPARVQIDQVLESRYSDLETRNQITKDSWFVPELNRPMSWDNRSSGLDLVRVTGGGEIKLLSSGMQSVPKPGWVLLLTSGDAENGYTWTLYGLPAIF